MLCRQYPSLSLKQSAHCNAVLSISFPFCHESQHTLMTCFQNLVLVPEAMILYHCSSLIAHSKLFCCPFFVFSVPSIVIHVSCFLYVSARADSGLPGQCVRASSSSKRSSNALHLFRPLVSLYFTRRILCFPTSS